MNTEYGRVIAASEVYAWLVAFMVSGVGMWRVLRGSGANAESG